MTVTSQSARQTDRRGRDPSTPLYPAHPHTITGSTRCYKPPGSAHRPHRTPHTSQSGRSSHVSIRVDVSYVSSGGALYCI